MIFPDVPLKLWLDRHSLEVATDSCDGCGKEIKTTIPFIERRWVGLISPACSCGNGGDFIIQKPRIPEAIAWVDDVYSSISSDIPLEE